MGNQSNKSQKLELDLRRINADPSKSESYKNIVTDEEEEKNFNPVLKPVLSRYFKPPGAPEGWKYPYRHRRMNYRNEKYEVSESEAEVIKKFMATATKVVSYPEEEEGERVENRRRKIIIDTDIGTDVDDVLAILMALQMPRDEVEVLAITTNYFPTKVRARVATNILDLFNESCQDGEKVETVVSPGSDYLCGTHRRVLACGNEGKGLVPELTIEELRTLREPVADDSREAVDVILTFLKEYPGEVTIVSIGIPTNLARCVVEEPSFASLVDRVFVMGGGSPLSKANKRSLSSKPLFELDEEKASCFASVLEGKPIILFPNHNISGDTIATKVLMESGCKIFMVSHDITAQYWLKGKSIETLIEASASPERYPKFIHLGGRLVLEWFKLRFGQRGQCPHDPLTVYEAVYADESVALGKSFVPGRGTLRYVRGDFVCHEWACYLTFIPSGEGSHFLAVETGDKKGWLRWLEETLISSVPEEDVVEHSRIEIR